MTEPFAWIVPYCPDFYFLPSLCYHKVFGEWDDGTWDCPAYWASMGLPIIPCYETDNESEAECWISMDKHGRWCKKDGVILRSFGWPYGTWVEALNASRSVGKSVHMLKFEFDSPVNRGPIVGPPPTFQLRGTSR